MEKADSTASRLHSPNQRCEGEPAAAGRGSLQAREETERALLALRPEAQTLGAACQAQAPSRWQRQGTGRAGASRSAPSFLETEPHFIGAVARDPSASVRAGPASRPGEVLMGGLILPPLGRVGARREVPRPHPGRPRPSGVWKHTPHTKPPEACGREQEGGRGIVWGVV